MFICSRQGGWWTLVGSCAKRNTHSTGGGWSCGLDDWGRYRWGVCGHACN